MRLPPNTGYDEGGVPELDIEVRRIEWFARDH
jgi:hypothetical protein